MDAPSPPEAPKTKGKELAQTATTKSAWGEKDWSWNKRQWIEIEGRPAEAPAKAKVKKPKKAKVKKAKKAKVKKAKVVKPKVVKPKVKKAKKARTRSPASQKKETLGQPASINREPTHDFF